MNAEVQYYDVTIDLTRPVDHPLAAVVPRKPTIEQIRRAQDYMVKHVEPVELTPEHYFAEGMYGRELFIPAGLVVFGKMHRHEHLVQLLSGEATVYTDKGMERIQGPRTWVSPPGVKRALMTHSDCLFFTVHLNADNSTDLEAIENYVIVPEPQLTHDLPQMDFADDLQGVYA